MELHISNRKNNVKIALIASLIGFGVAFFSAPFILNTVYGIEPGSPDYKQYFKHDGTPASFETNLMINLCIYTETPNMIIFDSRGLKDSIFDDSLLFSDRHHNDLDICKHVADQFLADGSGWILQDIDRSDGETVITLVR